MVAVNQPDKEGGPNGRSVLSLMITIMMIMATVMVTFNSDCVLKPFFGDGAKFLHAGEVFFPTHPPNGKNRTPVI